MAYGAIKVDNITFTNGGADQATTVSGIYRAITSGVTVTGTISGVTIQGTTVSGTTVTGTTANFTSGVFTVLSGASTTVTSGIFAAGSAAAPSISFTSDPNTGIYSPGADQVAISSSGTGRLFIDSSGNVGIGTTPGAYRLDVAGQCRVLNSNTDSAIEIGLGTSTNQNAYVDLVTDTTYTDFGLRILRGNNGANTDAEIRNRGTGSLALAVQEAGVLRFLTTDTERARINSFGRLLVGTSSARAIEPYGLGSEGQEAHTYESVGDTSPGPGIALGSSSTTDRIGPYLYLFRSRGGSVGSITSVSSGDNLGTISFAGADGTDVRSRGAAIYCEVDGTPGTNDMPGRLVFSTTADGAASPTERMRIKSTGTINFSSVATYADNTAALAGGLVAGDVYRKSDGTLMITY
jgi:hypothetical protein